MPDSANFALSKAITNRMNKLLTVVVLALLMAGCKPKGQKEKETPVRVETERVSMVPNARRATYVGVIEEKTASAISFPVAGTILRVWVDEGEHVAKGQTLATLDESSAKHVYTTAKAALEQAKDAYARMKQLHDAESLPEMKWVEIQTKLQQAESAFEMAKENLDDCVLKAPFAGVIGKRMAAAGETAVPGVAVMTLLDISGLKVRFAVPEQEIGSMNGGQRVGVKVEALDGLMLQATDLEKGSVADALAHTYDIRATLKDTQGKVLPGMVCSVEVEQEAESRQVVLPPGCIAQGQDGTHFVWKVSGDRTMRQKVSLGGMAGNSVIIVGGLQDGDRIVTKGMQKVGEGTKIVWQ